MLSREASKSPKGVAAGTSGIYSSGDPTAQTVMINVDAQRSDQIVGVGM